MAPKTTLNAKNLQALGAERLAQLLIDLSTGDAGAKRKLRLALAGTQGPREAAHQIAKRLASIAKSRSVVTWRRRKSFVKDLETQRLAIMEEIAPRDPREALDLLWRFMTLATSVFERCDDSSGMVIDIFRHACADLGKVAQAAAPNPQVLASQVLDALQDNDFGHYDRLIPTMAPALGADGLAALKALVEDLAARPVPVPPKSEWKTAGWGSRGAYYAHEREERLRRSTVERALQDIADVQGDVDAYIAQYDAKTRKLPKIAADIAGRLLAVGRPSDALAALDAVAPAQQSDSEWSDARLATLEALDRTQDAQALRWDRFQRDLSPEQLRTYLKRLPDFEDIEAEDQAMIHAASHPNLLNALEFFLNWPALDHAARLVLDRHAALDGDAYDILTPAAEQLAPQHPLAATIALRAMIDVTLDRSRQKRYGYAAAHLASCAALSQRIDDFGAFETHAAYVARLKSKHGKKSGFWDI